MICAIGRMAELKLRLSALHPYCRPHLGAATILKDSKDAAINHGGILANH
jgi:hypothetical protein